MGLITLERFFVLKNHFLISHSRTPLKSPFIFCDFLPILRFLLHHIHFSVQQLHKVINEETQCKMWLQQKKAK